MTVVKSHPYYRFDRVMSYNAAYTMVCGGRGIGKTFGAQVLATRASIRKGELFIYLRRYKEELKLAKLTFFAEYTKKFPNHDFRVAGTEGQWAPAKTRDQKKREWHTLCYFIALSTAQSVKSVAFNKVTLILFDEFILEKSATHYLPDEANIFNNFYATVDRWQDKTRVLFLANAVTIMNPYFTAYDIVPNKANDIVVKRGGFLVAHFPDSEAFKASVNDTRFGNFIAGSEYADYAVGNVFHDNHEHLVKLKESTSKYMFTLVCHNGSFSVWRSKDPQEFFIQSRLPGQQLKFTLVPEKMQEDIPLMTFSDTPLKVLRTAFRSGNVLFDKPSTRNTFTDIFTR